VWMKSLPAGDYLPFADVVDLVAFGPAKVAIGLSDTDEHAAQLRAGIAIINDAIESRIKLVGTPCERLQTHPHLLRQIGHRIAIGSETLHDLIPVSFGGRDWLGPRRYADEHAEIGHASQSVSICGVMVERTSLLKWLTTASIKAPGLREADVTELVLSEKGMNPSVSIDEIVKSIQAKDPLFPRERIREIAREMSLAKVTLGGHIFPFVTTLKKIGSMIERGESGKNPTRFPAKPPKNVLFTAFTCM
jgi:hypothetical protein